MFEMDVNSIGALENMLDFIWIFFFFIILCFSKTDEGMEPIYSKPF